MKTAAIISSYNRGGKIKQTVNSLLAQTQPLDRIVVVDDGSPSGKKVPNFTSSKVKVDRLEKNVGVVWGRNYALSKVSDCDYILIIDDDIVLRKGTLKVLVNAFSECKDAVAVMPVVFFLKNKKQVWSAGSGVNLTTGQTLFYTQMPQDQYLEIPAATSVLLVKMDAIKKAGWYDPIYYFCYEDADFYYRLRKANKGKIYCAKDAIAYHDIPLESSLRRVAERSYHIGRGRVIFLSRFSNMFLASLFSVFGFSLYYFYIGFKYSEYFAGVKFLEGVFDGLKLVISGEAGVSNETRYRNDVELDKISKVKSLKDYSVR